MTAAQITDLINDEGARLVDLEAIEAELRSAGHQAWAVSCDVTDPQQVGFCPGDAFITTWESVAPLNPPSGSTPLVVQFTDTSIPGTAPITAWSWSFGDGGSTGGNVRLEANGRVYQVNVAWLTGPAAWGSMVVELGAPFVLIGGLGIGFTVTAALSALPDDGEIEGTHGNLGTDMIKVMAEVGVGIGTVFGGWPIPDSRAGPEGPTVARSCPTCWG